jgi:hypothetical protein
MNEVFKEEIEFFTRELAAINVLLTKRLEELNGKSIPVETSMEYFETMKTGEAFLKNYETREFRREALAFLESKDRFPNVSLFDNPLCQCK